MTVELGRRVVDGAWKTGGYVETEAGDGPIGQSVIQAYNGNLGGYTLAVTNAPCVVSVKEDDPFWYSISGVGGVSIPVVVTDYTAFKLYMGWGLNGHGPAPAVPADVQAIVAGWGADPSDKWDWSYSRGGVLCIAGSEAGKAANFAFNTGPKLIEDVLNTQDIAHWDTQTGDLACTLAADSIKVPANGTYLCWFGPFIDFYYP